MAKSDSVGPLIDVSPMMDDVPYQDICEHYNKRPITLAYYIMMQRNIWEERYQSERAFILSHILPAKRGGNKLFDDGVLANAYKRLKSKSCNYAKLEKDYPDAFAACVKPGKGFSKVLELTLSNKLPLHDFVEKLRNYK